MRQKKLNIWALYFVAIMAHLCCLGQDSNDDFAEFEAEFSIDDVEEVYDPFISYNKVMYRANDRLYIHVLKPVTKVYSDLIPLAGRSSVERFFTNILFPLRFVNNVLQLKLHGASVETGRFLCNTTAGGLGFFDPAFNWCGWLPRNEDFGQTLGHYGVGAGPPVVLPFFGQSNIRDAFSKVPDHFLNPLSYLQPGYVAAGVKTYDKINFISVHEAEFDSLRKDALVPYTFFRDAYLQMRNKEIEE